MRGSHGFADKSSLVLELLVPEALLALRALAFTEPSPHFGPQPTMIATSIATVTTAAIITRASRFLFKSASFV